MLSACDINHDGQISYDEFVKFCSQTEKELLVLFQSVDRDHNGSLDKSELSQAFERSGVAVSNARLDRFFGYIDKNHDGKIDFPEWRGMSLELYHRSCRTRSEADLGLARFSFIYSYSCTGHEADLQLLHHNSQTHR